MHNSTRLWLPGLFLLTLLVSACGGSGGPAATAPEALPASPGLAATQAPGVQPPTQAPGALPATAGPAATLPPAAAGEFQWQVSIIQGDQMIPAEAGDVVIARAPFTIRVVMPAPTAIKLNALDTDENFQVIQPGFPLNTECGLALCAGMDVAEEPLNPAQALYVDALSTHYLYYNSESDHRWSRVSAAGGGLALERDVALLNDRPVAEYSAPALYLLLLANPTNPDVIDPGELKKVTIIFQ